MYTTQVLALLTVFSIIPLVAHSTSGVKEKIDYTNHTFAYENELTITTYHGEKTRDFLVELSDVHSTVMQGFPYLLKSTSKESLKQLTAYTTHEHSIFGIARNAQKIIGMFIITPVSNVSWLSKRVKMHELTPKHGCYIAVFALVEKYRRSGVFRKMGDILLEISKQTQYAYIISAMVNRNDDHPQTPATYRPMSDILTHRGYHKIPDLDISTKWRQTDSDRIELNSLSLWIKEL